MRKSPILLSAFLLIAVGASAPKDRAKLSYDREVDIDGPYEGLAQGGAAPVRDYPECSRTVTDRCIQLYESRVRSARPRLEQPAMGGPIEGSASYPNCSRLITDECVQLFDRIPRPAGGAPRRARIVSPEGEADTPGI